MDRTIFFDMDGTFVDLYGVENWLEMLTNHNAIPYRVAKPLFNMNSFARILNRLQREGFRLAIISWLAKNSSEKYDDEVTKAKKAWLKKHLASVKWDEIIITSHGNAKENFIHTKFDILFDDEKKNREKWKGIAYNVNNLLDTLKAVA